MKVTQEKRPNSQMGLEIEITPERSKQVYDQVLADYSRKVNIPGFRKGKVPRQVLIQRLGSQNLKAAALEKLIEQAASEAIAQEKISALDNPELISEFEALVGEYKPGQPLTFNVAVDVPPEPQIKQYTGLTVKAEEVKYDPATVDRTLEEQRQKQATLIPVEDRPAQMGDVTTIDFVGRIVDAEGSQGDTEIPGGKASEFQLNLEPGAFIPGFIEGIVGMGLSETKEIPVQFPEDYPQEDLKGKQAVFAVTLSDIKEKELPELDDEFAAEVSEFETLAQLRSDLESTYKGQAERQTAANKSQGILSALLEQLEVEIPASTIASEVDSMVSQTVYELANQGLDVQKVLTREMVTSMRDRTRPEAIAQIKRNLVVTEIAHRESIEVSAEAIEAKMTEILAQYSDRDKEIIDREKLAEAVRIDLLQEKVLAWVEERSTIELVEEGSLKPPAESETSSDQSQAEATSEEAAPAEQVPAEAIDSEQSLG